MDPIDIHTESLMIFLVLFGLIFEANSILPLFYLIFLLLFSLLNSLFLYLNNSNFLSNFTSSLKCK